MKRPKANIKKMTARRTTLIVIVGAISVGLIGAVGWHAYSWQQYTQTNDDHYNRARQEVMRQLSQVESRDDIKQISQLLTDERAKLCQAPILTSLRVQLLSEARDYQESCQRKQNALADASTAAKRLHDRLETEAAVAEVYKNASAKLKKAALDDYAAHKNLWRQTEKELLQIEVDSSYQAVIDKQQQAIRSISQRYDRLIKADKAEKRTQFDDAAVELRDAYGELEAAKKQTSSSYRGLTETLYDAIDRL